MRWIENEYLRAGFLDQGAEWRSFQEKVWGQELLWQADPAYWGKSAPILFPIVGSLKDNRYVHQGATYPLGRHGFARESVFQVVEHEKSGIVFRLESSEQTRKVYPFDWSLEVEYRLSNKVLLTTYRVRNLGQTVMPFSIGAHPAFRVPLHEDESFEDYRLEFELAETLERHFLNADGVFSGETQILPTVGKILNLSHSLFDDDAIVLKRPKSARVALRNAKNLLGVSLEYPGFPYLGIWTPPKKAPFVCLEPWCGVADSVTSTGRIEDKEGINLLEPEALFKRNFAVTVEGI